MKAIILAAGYATRLYPLTLNTPKCLLSVSGRTILDRLFEKLRALSDLDEVIIVTNAKFYGQLEDWKKSGRFPFSLKILNDGTLSNDTRLGAIGDLDFVLKNLHIQDDILMLASDNLFESNLNGFVDFSRSKKDKVCVALYDIKDTALAANKFGVLEVDGAGEVKGIEEKPEKPRSSLIGMGVYYFPKQSLGFISEYLKDPNAKDAPGHYVRWLLGRAGIFGFLFSGLWYDIGDLKALEEANKIFP